MDNEYLKMVQENRNKLLKLTKKQHKEIIELYKQASKDLESKALKSKRGSLSERVALDYKKQIDITIKELSKALYNSIKDNIKESANLSVELQLSFFDSLDEEYELGISDSFGNMFSKIPTEVLNEIISSNFYKDGKGLSRRVWVSGKKLEKDIDYIIKQAIIQNKSVVEFAKDLEQYVNPKAKKHINWSKIYPNLKGKKVEFNSFRLAQTSISHSYAIALFKSSSKNPYIEGIKWHSALNDKRTCDVCRGRHGKIFTVDDCPLDHPLGLCAMIPYVPMSFDEIGKELGGWLKGKHNKKLDIWYKTYGKEFII